MTAALELLNGFNVGLELRNGLLTIVWYSPLIMVWRHTIPILIFHGEDGSSALAARQPIREFE